MINKLIRGGITFLGFWLGCGVFVLFRFIANQTKFVDLSAITGFKVFLTTGAVGIIFAILFFILTPRIIKQSARASRNIEVELQKFSGSGLLAGVIGLIIGLVIAYLISPVFGLIENGYLSAALTVVIYLVFAWLGIVVGSRTGGDAFSRFQSQAAKRAEGFTKPKSRSHASTPKILDTSVIIDGRIADIMRTGFIEGQIVIPDFVLIELRHIADSSDGLKRNRGRRGLDILNKIQNDFGIEIYNTANDKNLADVPEVDVKLLKLAQAMKGKVVTNDFNLNKVAHIQNVGVLNINDLAGNLKPVVLPGEKMSIFLVKEGKETGQAVAYLDDGTMIVVEGGKSLIGKNIDVTVTSVLQTSAGRMIFAKP
ncbi:MAG: PIN domain-containing protein [Clostridiales Family XIII bacterium]|jgi:uncharacterized protein YacL|nr:PIN domain-containing protein [Clostridiales Family XIII bacterium]